MLRATALLLLLTALTFPAAAQPPPWAVESPAAAGDGARFGLGLDAFFENQKSLRIASQQSVTVLEGADGSLQPMVVDGDPELLNRKFDLEWELHGAGVYVPLALSCFRLTDLIQVFPTLTFEAASADVTLDILDKPEPEFSTSLHGRGPLFGTKMSLTATLGVRWFTGTTYRYRNLPSLNVDRSPPFAEPGFEVLHDEVRLSQEIHEVSAKVGYLSVDRKTAYYTGTRTRWTDVEIEDELRLRDEIVGRETELNSRSKLDSEVFEAIVGVNSHIRNSLFARVELTFGDQDYGALVQVVSTWPSKRSPEQIALSFAPLLNKLRIDFAEAKATIDSSGSPPDTYNKILQLLSDTEQALLAILSGTELAAMRSYVENRFKSARAQLAAESMIAAKIRSERPHSRLVSVGLNKRPANAIHLGFLQNAPGVGAMDSAQSLLDRLWKLSENNDVAVSLCVKTKPESGARVSLQPQGYPAGLRKVRSTNRKLTNVYRGLWVYRVTRPGYKDIDCFPDAPDRTSTCAALDMVEADRPLLVCDLAQNEEQTEGDCAIEEESPIERCLDEN